MSDQELRARLAAFMAAHNVLTLATCGPDGPWASPVFYAEDVDLRLTFFSSPGSRHGRNLAASPRAAGAIAADNQDWRAIQGVQLEGAVQMLRGPDRADAEAVYLRKFPFAAALIHKGVELYRLTPARVILVDNTRGFGHRDRLDLTPPGRPV